MRGALQTTLAPCMAPSAAIARCRTARAPCLPPRPPTRVLLLSISTFLLLPLLLVFVTQLLNPNHTAKGLLQHHFPVVHPSCIPPFFLAWQRRCALASCSPTSLRMGSHTSMHSMGVRQSTRSPTSSRLRTVTLHFSSAARLMPKSTS